jgi:transcriptional regulator with XRE-family HTH domain
MGLKNQTLNRLLTRLKLLRRLHGYTQEKFAEKAGFSYKYYQALEAGRKGQMRLSTIEKLARGYSIEVYQLFSPKPPRVKIAKRGKLTGSKKQRR